MISNRKLRNSIFLFSFALLSSSARPSVISRSSKKYSFVNKGLPITDAITNGKNLHSNRRPRFIIPSEIVFTSAGYPRCIKAYEAISPDIQSILP